MDQVRLGRSNLQGQRLVLVPLLGVLMTGVSLRRQASHTG
jgi:hypothetical protein